MPDVPNLQLPTNMPQFVPPPLPPVMMNPVPVQGAPVIKPPTVPLDNYDPKEALEDKMGEASGMAGDSQRGEKRKNDKRKFVRVAGSQTWEDETLSEWDSSTIDSIKFSLILFSFETHCFAFSIPKLPILAS